MFVTSSVSEAKNPEKLITCLPGNIPPLKPTDLLSFYRAQDPSDILFNAFLYESQKQSKGDYVLVNTFEELEGRDAVTALSLNGCPALAIGPLFLPNFLEGRDSCSSLWEEEESCLTWLDMQQPGSVIYVSFGSIAVKSEQQLEQLALGLEGSGQPFLWVLRLDIAEGQAAILPEGFEERTKETGTVCEVGATGESPCPCFSGIVPHTQRMELYLGEHEHGSSRSGIPIFCRSVSQLQIRQGGVEDRPGF
jgi:hypothetical protein